MTKTKPISSQSNQQNKQQHEPKKNQQQYDSFILTTYNIHKGMSVLNKTEVTEGITKALHNTNSDIYCLQEVQGRNERTQRHSKQFDCHNEPHNEPQHEWLSKQLHCEQLYRANDTYKHGHHGNAILSKQTSGADGSSSVNFENLIYKHNLDLSVNPLESRGLLHAQIHQNNSQGSSNNHRVINILSTHLNLLEYDRNKQYQRIIRYINEHIDPQQPLILAGDFNDWTQVSERKLGDVLGLQEVVRLTTGKLQATFPAKFPLLSLDRIYVRNLTVNRAWVHTGKPWNMLSDHLPVSVELI